MSPQPFHLPWLRLSFLIRSILGTSWDEETWPTVKTTLARATRATALTVAWVAAMVLLAASDWCVRAAQERALPWTAIERARLERRP
jgi:hypothetical protein